MNIQTQTSSQGVPATFLNKFDSAIQGVLCEFARLRVRATQRLLFQPNSMESYLAICKFLIKDFKKTSKSAFSFSQLTKLG